MQHIINGGGYIGDELPEDLLRIEIEDEELADSVNELSLDEGILYIVLDEGIYIVLDEGIYIVLYEGVYTLY